MIKNLTRFSLRCTFGRNGRIIHQNTRSVMITAPAQVYSWKAGEFHQSLISLNYWQKMVNEVMGSVQTKKKYWVVIDLT